jgi:hypothetical protein
MWGEGRAHVRQQELQYVWPHVRHVQLRMGWGLRVEGSGLRGRKASRLHGEAADDLLMWCCAQGRDLQ